MTENSNQQNNLDKGIGGSPKNLMIPFLLLSLRGGFGLHGYKLIQQLTQLGFSSIDQGNVYRLLRQLEKDSLVKSEWDTSSSGPAKRIYSITDAGLEYLDLWAESLEQYQSMLDSFFNMYSNMFMPFVPKGKKEDPEPK